MWERNPLYVGWLKRKCSFLDVTTQNIFICPRNSQMEWSRQLFKCSFLCEWLDYTCCTLSFIITPQIQKEKNERQEEIRSGKYVIITLHEEQITIQKMVPLNIAPGLTSLMPKATGSPMLCYLSHWHKFEYGTAFKRYCRIRYFPEMQLCCHDYHGQKKFNNNVISIFVFNTLCFHNNNNNNNNHNCTKAQKNLLLIGTSCRLGV